MLVAFPLPSLITGWFDHAKVHEMRSVRRLQDAIKCSVCAASFARQEHLTRHMRIHTREKPFQCLDCGKRFSRLDVLNRHSASHSGDVLPAGVAASSRACRQCAAGRVRCSRGQPCKRCFERNVGCIYPVLRKSREASSQTQRDTFDDAIPLVDTTQHQTEFHGTQRRRQQPKETDATSTPFQPGQGTLVPVRENFNDASGMAAASNLAWLDGFEPMSFDSPYQTGYDLSQPNLAMSGVNWMSPQSHEMVDWNTQLAGFAVNREDLNGPNNGFPFFFDASDPDPAQDPGPEMPWRATVTDSPPMSPTNHAVSGSRLNETEQSSQRGLGSTTSKSSEGKYYVDGTGARAPFGGRFTSRLSLVSIDAMKQGASGIVTSQSTGPTESLVSVHAYENMLDGIRSESKLCNFELHPESFPSFPQVQLYVRRYFDNFHPIFPFLKKFSFSKDALEEWILLLAVCTIGARYLRRRQGAEPAEMLLQILYEILDHSRYGMATAGSMDDMMKPGQLLFGSRAKIQTIQAGILGTLCMLHSGKTAQMRFALEGRRHLVEACNIFGYISSRHANDIQTAPVGSSTDSFLSEWIERETEIRTGLTIWLLDSMALYQFNAKSYMDLDDVRCVLPCDDDIWENPDDAKKISKIVQITMVDALEMLYMKKRVPSNLGEFSASLIINAIYRRTKDIAKHEQTRMNYWTPTNLAQHRSRQVLPEEPWLPNTKTMSKWRNSACDCLDMLHWAANSKAARFTGFEQHTILHLHISRLIMLTPTRYIQTFATESSGHQWDGEGPNDQRYAYARDQVLQWAVRDQFKARLAVIHCGALIWYVRRYSCDSVMEPYGIYTAILVLWAFCVSERFAGRAMNEPRNNAQQQQNGPAAANTPSDMPVSPSLHVEEEEEEEEEPSFFHLDRPLDDELVQAFVRRGHLMSGYMTRIGNIRDAGAPKRLLLEGIRLLERDAHSRSHGNGGGHAADTREKPMYTWGIEASYIESLQLLVRATTGELE